MARPGLRGVAALSLALLASSAPATSRADEPRSAPPPAAHAPTRDEVRPRLEWNPDWPRFRAGEYVATGIFAVATIGSLLIPPAPDRWRGRNGFDEGARDALRAGSLDGRDIARDASDVLLTTSAAYPVLVDAVVIAWSRHGSADVAWQMAMIDFEAFMLTTALNGMVAATTSRERPYGRECPESEEDQNKDCREYKRYRSFFSGHASTAFTTAGLICMHHAHLDLYGGGAADVVPCVSGFGVAGAVAALRVVLDQHYLSDVLVGAAMGTTVGLGVPWLLHYRGGALRREHTTTGATWLVAPLPGGASIAGTF
jgi:hypothetical protein